MNSKLACLVALLGVSSFAFGDTASNASFEATPAVSNLVKKLSWCSLGTSITDFNDNPITGRTQGYQFFTMDKLGWSHDKLLNVGHSGSTIGVANDFPKDTPYDIYTIEFGVNDWAKGHIVGTMNDYNSYLYNKSVRWYVFAACYRNVIETIRKANPNAAIVLTTPRKAHGSDGDVNVSGFPRTCDGLTLESQLTKTTFWDPETETYPDEQTYLADYAELIRQIAAQENLVLCDWYAEAATEENLASLSVDVAVHPNDAGYEIMADLLAPKILEAVSRIDFCKDGHNWGEWVVTKEASETETGLQHHTCQRCGEEEEFVIPKIVHIVALRNVAVATAVGTEPALPATVKGLFANGAVSEEDYAVAWDNADAPSEEGVTTVSGTATVEGKSMSVTAFVRAETAPAGTFVNISPNATATTDDAKGAAVAASLLSTVAPTALEWITSNRNERKNLVDTLTWEANVNVSKVRICYYCTGNYKAPKSYAFSADSVEIPSTSYVAGAVEASGNQQWAEFTFNEPISLKSLSCSFEDPGNWLIVERIWAYELQAGGKIEPLTTDTLSTLEVDGVAVAGFAPTTYSYEVENGETITAASATDNMGITILPKYDGAAYAVTLAEDGESTKTYTVSMPSRAICLHEHQQIVDAVAATCMTVGHTRSVYCEDCKTYLETAEEIPALGHLWSDWEVTKNPTTTEAGSKHRVCQRQDCGEEEIVTIPTLKPFVALRNVAGVAGVGRAFTLPTTVKGIDANGELTDDLDVIWPSATVAYDVPGLYTVEGYASADPTKAVTATIRVVPITTAYTNVSPEATPDTSATDRSKLARLVSDTLPDITWITTNNRNGDFWDKLTWPTAKTISYVDIYYQSNHEIGAVAFETETGAAITYSMGEIQQFTDYKLVRYTFAAPASVTALKCTFTGPSGKYVTVNRIWAYESEGEAEIVPSSNAALSDLKVDDKTVIDFDPETTEYTAYNGKAITAATAEDNVVVTILPKNEDDNAFVITMAEDGIATKTYTVAMPTVNIAALRNVALVVGVNKAFALPNTVMALTPTGELVGEMPVEWIDAPSSYATAGKYTVMGRAKTDASLTVTASIRAVEYKYSYENISKTATPTTTDTQCKNIATLISEATADDNWVTSNRARGDLADTLTWNQSVNLKYVEVYFQSNHKISTPTFSTEDGVEIPYVKSGEEKIEGKYWKVQYTFNDAVKLTALTCAFPSPGDQQYLTVNRIWAFAEDTGAESVPSSNAKPTAITGNGVAVKDFDPDNTEKIWKIASRKNIAIASDDNIAVTVLPEDANRIIRIVTVSEDGSSTKTYKLQLANGFILFVL